MFAQVEFPPIENIVEWPEIFFKDTPVAFNKIGLINLIAVIVPVVMFLVAAAKYKSRKVPKGIQTITESSIGFIENGIIMQTIGPDGLRYLPLLISLFFFILIGNLFEVIPGFPMPANAPMANPMVLAVMVLVIFVAVGIKHNGPAAYFKTALFPPGVPKMLYILVTPIELLSTFIVRPFSLAVRLFANMLAGHILLVTFAVLCITTFTLSLLIVIFPFAFGMLTALTAFEIMVSFLQAYIFTILTAVYIGGALHPDH